MSGLFGGSESKDASDTRQMQRQNPLRFRICCGFGTAQRRPVGFRTAYSKMVIALAYWA